MHTFTGIGVGPGDPELMTLKGIKAIENARTVFVPKGQNGKPGTAYTIAKGFIPENTPVIELEFPMIKVEQNREILESKWRGNAEDIKMSLAEGDAVFLTLGDPSIYSTFSYIAQFLQSFGIEVKTISGISAFSALGAHLNTPLVLGEESLAVVNMNQDRSKLKQALDLHENVLVMKVSADPEGLYALLERRPDRDFYLISNLGMDTEKISTDIKSLKEKVPYFSTALIKRKE